MANLISALAGGNWASAATGVNFDDVGFLGLANGEKE